MTTTNFVAKFFHYNFVTKHLKKKSRKYFLKIVNVQINGATISWTCLSSLCFVLSWEVQTGFLFSIEEELPNWPISPCSPSSSTLKLGPLICSMDIGLGWVVPFLEVCLGPSNSNQIGSLGKWDYPACIQTFTTTILSRSIIITVTLW